MIRLIRPLRCYEWCDCCYRQEMEVQSPPGTTVGWIKQDLSWWYTWMSIQDASGQTVLKIKGPCCTCDWCENEFQVKLAPSSPCSKPLSVVLVWCHLKNFLRGIKNEVYQNKGRGGVKNSLQCFYETVTYQNLP